MVDPDTGVKVPVCRNPDTGKAWSLGTIGEDARFLRAGWKEALEQERQSQRAELLAVLREVRAGLLSRPAT